MAATAVGPVVESPGLPGGSSALLNITAAQVVKAAPAILIRIIPVIVGTGTLTLNDCATTGAVATANQIAAIPAASMTAGVPIVLEWPCETGIVISTITAGGQFSVSFS